jgi:hypothetical protein
VVLGANLIECSLADTDFGAKAWHPQCAFYPLFVPFWISIRI